MPNITDLLIAAFELCDAASDVRGAARHGGLQPTLSWFDQVAYRFREVAEGMDAEPELTEHGRERRFELVSHLIEGNADDRLLPLAYGLLRASRELAANGAPDQAMFDDPAIRLLVLHLSGRCGFSTVPADFALLRAACRAAARRSKDQTTGL